MKLYINGVLKGSTTANAAANNNMDSQGKIGLVNAPSHAVWKGNIDNVADYHSALSVDELKYHWELGAVENGWYATRPGVTKDVAPPSEEPDPAQSATFGTTSINSPQNNSQYSPDAQAFKAPLAAFSCWDPTSGGALLTSGLQTQLSIASCTAMVDGNPIANGAPLPLSPGTHALTLTSVDLAGNVWVHTHTYYVTPANSGYLNVIKCTNPAVASPGCDAPLAYYRLNEAASSTAILDSSGNSYDGEYKNDQTQGGTGVTGDLDKTRAFFGEGGYAAVNNIAAPLYGYTLEAWWKPADDGGMAIVQHGSNGTLWYDGANVRFRPDERSASVASVALPTPSASGNWYYVAGTYDGITAKLYVEESVSPNVKLTHTNSVPFHKKDGAGSADTFYLGFANDIGLASPWLRGELDEVAYYGTALGAAKLAQHYNADPPAGDVHYVAPSKAPAATPAAAAPAAATPATASRKGAAAKAKAKAKARAKARAKAKTKALKKARARAKAKAKARAKAQRKARARARHRAAGVKRLK